MAGRTRKLFGLICFLWSFGLFGLIWALNQRKLEFRKSEFAIHEVDISHLSEKRVFACLNTLIKIKQNLGTEKKILPYLELFNNFCFNLPTINNILFLEIQQSFDVSLWADFSKLTLLQRIVSYILGHTKEKRLKYVLACKYALEKDNLKKALLEIDRIPHFTLCHTCLDWKKKLSQLTASHNLLKKAGCKLLCDDSIKI